MKDFKIAGITVEETVSTNNLAKELLQKKELQAPFYVQTDFQSEGRGQYAKTWESEAKENLLFSLVIQPKGVKIENQFEISKAVAVSVLQVLQKNISGVSIKWPNDIYVDNKKIAGILIENIIVGPNIEHCVIGIGLNVNQTSFSKALPNPTSIKTILQREVDINSVKEEIIEQILSNLGNYNFMHKVYLEHLYRKGELGQFKDLTGDTFLGVILGITDIGQLTIRVENNQQKHFANSEIQYILPEIN